MANFRRGVQQAEESAKFTRFQRTEYLKIEDGESEIVRFLTDAAIGEVIDGYFTPCDHEDKKVEHNDTCIGGWITVNQHGNIPTKAKPDDWKSDKNWPTAMGAVCRHDQAFKGVYDDCFICDVLTPQNSKIKKPAARQWAMACLREEVRGDGTEETGGPAMKGKVVGYRDKTRTVERKIEGSDKTEEVEEKAIIVVNQGHKNFFAALAGFANFYGTTLDRDYYIKRKGEGTATDYDIIPMDPISMKDPETGGSVPFDLRNEKLLQARYGHTHETLATLLEEVVTASASDDNYARWFNPNAKPSSATEGGSGNAAPADDEPGEDAIAALKDRIQSYGPDSKAGAPEAPKEEPAAPPAAQEPAPAGAGAGGAIRDFD